jgi:hypothetical protein
MDIGQDLDTSSNKYFLLTSKCDWKKDSRLLTTLLDKDGIMDQSY